MFEKLLNKLGYIKEETIDDNYCLFRVASMVGDPTEYEISEELETEFFRDLSKIEVAHKYFDATLAKDMQREFSAPLEQRDLIHGAFARIAYLKSKLVKYNK